MTTLAPILAKLGARIILPNETSASTAVIQRVTVHAPAETVCGENLKRIPVVGNAGAGSAMEFFEHAPDSWIPVLPLYFLPEMRAFKVTGDSMEPTIRKGAYIGVVPYSGALSEGSIYLVRDPHFGHIVKRIRKDRSGKLMLFSDNPNWEPVPMPHEGYENVVVGEVRWVWQQL
jgi:phage repressor protein C with HTH and peptisase S24 domain